MSLPRSIRPVCTGLLLTAGLALPLAAQTTVTDDFSTSHDFSAGDVSGTIWSGLLNGAANSTGSISTDGSGILTLTSSGTGWDYNFNNGYLLYVNVPVATDFVAQVVVVSNSVVLYNDFGLMARSATGGEENWVAARYFGGSADQNILRSVSGASAYNTSSGPTDLTYLQLARTGNTFTYSASASGFDSLTVIDSVTRSDMDTAGPLQVGLWQGTFSGATGYVNFASFSLATAAAIPEPATYAALVGVGALGLAALRRKRAA